MSTLRHHRRVIAAGSKGYVCDRPVVHAHRSLGRAKRHLANSFILRMGILRGYGSRA